VPGSDGVRGVSGGFGGGVGGDGFGGFCSVGMTKSMGANNGTGQPRTLRCAQCRKSRAHADGKGYQLEATGRFRQRKGLGGARRTHRAIEIICRDCGHVGWTSHRDAEDLVAAHAAKQDAIARSLADRLRFP
jgi:hypothetical protein